jgi:hypothetical protein
MFVYKDIEEKKGASKVSAQPEACPLLPTTARPARAKSSLSRVCSPLCSSHADEECMNPYGLLYGLLEGRLRGLPQLTSLVFKGS